MNDVKEKKPEYEITVHEKDEGHYEGRYNARKFITIKLLSWSGVDQTLSRGSRVWLVYEVGDKGTHLVLKDTWIQFERPREGQNLTMIREDIRKLPDGRDLLEHFLTLVTHGDVQIEERTDSTQALHQRGHSLTTSYSLGVSSTGGTVSVSSSQQFHKHGGGALPQLYNPEPLPEPFTFPHKAHYRFVVKESGQDLQSLKNRQQMFVIFTHQCKGV